LQARELVLAGKRDEAAVLVAQMLMPKLTRAIDRVSINSDEYSLNSVSGRVHFADESDAFFKFHVEEEESEHVDEYYRAQLLVDHGLPVDVPIARSGTPGEQFVVYEVRDTQRMSDWCVAEERTHGTVAQLNATVMAARHTLDITVGNVLTRTLEPTEGEGQQKATIHQLFWNRMHTTTGEFPGGRLVKWYFNNPAWEKLADTHWEIDNVHFQFTINELLAQAHEQLNPSRLAQGPVVVAHGDDHHGNIWLVPTENGYVLQMFDPAFAGDDIPALLSLVKSTFHNVFAHPFWLYHPEEIGPTLTSFTQTPTCIKVVHGNLKLSPMRQAILDSLVEYSWIPLLLALRDRGLLQEQWQQIIRLSLFLCPLLVTNLLDDSRNQACQMFGLAHAVMMGSPSDNNDDPVSAFMLRLQQAVEQS